MQAPGLESCGVCFIALRGALGADAVLLDTRLAAEGITTVDPAGWYPTQIELDVLYELSEDAQFLAGWGIPDFVAMPRAENILAAYHGLDIGYHLNHRRGGRPMYDTIRWRMEDGIGNFEVTALGLRKAQVRAPGPFPSHFNFGLVTRIAQLHEPQAEVILQSLPTTPDGPTAYVIRW